MPPPRLLFAILVALLAVNRGSHGSLHCAERREISPCSCRTMNLRTRTIDVVCERMTSFGQVVTALKDKFPADVHISLKVAYSQLPDLGERGFHELRISITRLSLNYDNISRLPASSFGGLSAADFISLADNPMPSVPAAALAIVPRVRTLDLGRGELLAVAARDFQALGDLQTLVLLGNKISVLEGGALPLSLRHLHLGHNHIASLNGTLKNLVHLDWLLLNGNRLSSLDNELPCSKSTKLALVHISGNHLRRLPPDLAACQYLHSVFAEENEIVEIGQVFRRARLLQIVYLTQNRIQKLQPDEFSEAVSLEKLRLGFNELVSLNVSLTSAKMLKELNVTHNLLEVFSMAELRGPDFLEYVDLSHNRISRLLPVSDAATTPPGLKKLPVPHVEFLHLEFNLLRTLDGALTGIHGLQRVNLSHNLLEVITPSDLMGLDQLRVLDLSYNRLQSMDATAQAPLHVLEELFASHNELTALEVAFQGMPALCRADISYNRVSRLTPDLIANTRCFIHSVPSTLRIYLQNNSLNCDQELARTLKTFESNMTEIHGVLPCDSSCPPAVVVPAPIVILPPPPPPTSTTTTTTPLPTTTTTTTTSTTSTTPAPLSVVPPLPPKAAIPAEVHAPVELPPVFHLLNGTKPAAPPIDPSAMKPEVVVQPEVLVQPAEDLPPLDDIPLLVFLQPTKPPNPDIPPVVTTPSLPPEPPSVAEVTPSIAENTPPPPSPPIVESPVTTVDPPRDAVVEVDNPGSPLEGVAQLPAAKSEEPAGKIEDPTNAEFPPEIRIQLLNQTDA